MSTVKDVYISFYAVKNNILFVSNGFSFGRESEDNYLDIFIDRDASKEEVREQLDPIPESADRVFVSVSMREEFALIKPFIRKHWIIGGNVSSSKDRKEVLSEKHNEKNTKAPCTMTSQLLENYLKGDTCGLSSDFNYYFEPLVKEQGIKNIVYNCTIGQGCYWGKCKFCGFHLTNNKVYKRPDLKKILSMIPPNELGGTSQVHLGIPAITPDMLYDVLSMDWPKSVCPIIFIRADKKIIEVLERFDPKDRIGVKKKFCLGMEILSDTALKIIQKGTTVDNILKTAKLLLDHGAFVEIETMTDFPFLTEEIFSEVEENCKKLKELYDSYTGPRNYIWIFNNGPILWPSKELASSFNGTFEDSKPMHESLCEEEAVMVGYNLFKSPIEPDSKVYKLNRLIEDTVKGTGISVRNSFQL